MNQPVRTTILLVAEGVRIPGVLPSLDAFREWARSLDFPERGRIDWIGGEVEVDMCPEDLNTHGTPKGAIARGLQNQIELTDRGVVLIDSFRMSSPEADLSAEPDVLVLLRESVEAGRVRLIPRASGEEGRFVEVEGAADLVVECVSDSSETKDLKTLPPRYYRAGVQEIWIVDARRPEPRLIVLSRGAADWIEAPTSPDGFRCSRFLGCELRLKRIPVGSMLVRYELECRAQAGR